MNHLGLTLNQKKQNLHKIRKRFNTAFVAVLLVSLLPLLIYFLFSFNVLETLQSKAYSSMEMSTALVIVPTSGKTGSAFLVSENKLLTARHVVDDLKVGETVNLVFAKAVPEINTTATLEWKADGDIPTDTNVPLEYFLTDVAVLRLTLSSDLENIEPFFLGDSDGIANLTPVVAIGYPAGDFSIKRGDINSDMFNGEDLFKVDPSVNAGDSGGPLILEDDKTVIGMMVGGLSGSEGENIAIKVNTMLELINNAGITIE